MPVLHYRELIAWQKAKQLAVEVYRESKQMPREELYGLTNQMRRAGVSIPSNIAEGQGRGSTAEFVRLLNIANGSRQELETQIMIALELDFMSQESVDKLLQLSEEVGRILSGLLRSIAPANH